MKRILFMLAGLLFMFASCSDGGSDSPETPKPQPQPEANASITFDSDITSSGLVFDEQGGEKSVSFTTNKDWTLSIAATTRGTSWCTASEESGSKGDVTIKFTVTENTEIEDRSVAVTIKAGTASQTFKIAQKGVDALLVTTSTFEVPQEGGTIDVEVKANIDYQLEIAETAKGWITEATSRALTAKKHSFAIAVNEESEKREGEIYIKSGDKLETVKVYQAGGALILLSQNEYTVSDAGETITVDVKSNVEYGVQMPDVDWIVDEASTRGMSSHTLQYTILPNETYDSRSAEIIFYDKNSDLKDTLTMTQVQMDAIVLSKKEFEVEAEGEIIEVKLSTNVDVDVQIPSDATWITQTDSRALTEKSIYLNVAENVGEESRSVEVVFVNNESQISESITINQTGKAGYADGVVTIVTAGTLKKILVDNYFNITSLKIVGPINGTDISFLRKMTGSHEFYEKDWGNLTTLDLSEATIVEGGAAYYELYRSSLYGTVEFYTSNNEIGNYMFYSCTRLKNIVLPNNATYIGEAAFSGCSSLASVIIGNGVTEIRELVFYGCSSLASVTIGNGVTRIGKGLFSSCSSLASVTIGNGVTEIGASAFRSCSSLASVTIGNGVTEIGASAFRSCSSLASVTIGNGVTEIGEKAFYDCDALTSITIPDNVTYIGDEAFKVCDALTSITIPDNVTYMGDEAFHACSSLASVTIGNGVTEIGATTFSGCSSLTSITIPDNVTYIGDEAFLACSSLASVTIGNGVTEIGARAFHSCSLTSITIPDNVTEIGERAFQFCNALTSVSIGKSVHFIYSYAFANCPSLIECYCYATNPPVLTCSDVMGTKWDNFPPKTEESTLYVPAGCSSKYKDTVNGLWAKFFNNIIEMEK